MKNKILAGVLTLALAGLFAALRAQVVEAEHQATIPNMSTLPTAPNVITIPFAEVTIDVVGNFQNLLTANKPYGLLSIGYMDKGGYKMTGPDWVPGPNKEYPAVGVDKTTGILHVRSGGAIIRLIAPSGYIPLGISFARDPSRLGDIGTDIFEQIKIRSNAKQPMNSLDVTDNFKGHVDKLHRYDYQFHLFIQEVKTGKIAIIDPPIEHDN